MQKAAELMEQGLGPGKPVEITTDCREIRTLILAPYKDVMVFRLYPGYYLIY